VQRVYIGAPIRFVPAGFTGESAGALPGHKPIPREVTGRVIYINREHRTFTVAYEVNGYRLRETMKF